MRSWFPNDEACLDYLDWVRWSEGFVCPHCGDVCSWKMKGDIRRCQGCRRRVSTISGTIFANTRVPLTAWFETAWAMTTGKQGVSASEIHRTLDLGSYQTAWMMLHRYRQAMGTTGTALLRGDVEVDETFIGGYKPGTRGRGAAGKVEVAIAVELLDPKGYGRCRMRVIPDTRATTVKGFLQECVQTGSLIISDGHKSYPAATGDLYLHKPYPLKGSGTQAHMVLPGVHRLASLVKRWMLGTHQGYIQPDHAQAYLDEFVFRFNRRRSKQRGMLFYRLIQASLGVGATTYKDFVINSQPKKVKPLGRTGPKVMPRTLAIPAVDRPWREVEG